MFKAIIKFLTGLFHSDTPNMERPSPKIRITEAQARAIFELIKTIPGYEHCYLAAIEPKNSMEPGVDDGMYVLLDPVLYHDLIVGDIIYYEHPYFRAIHRITKIDYDKIGWFAETKGDNNNDLDPFQVRLEHLRGVWRITLD